MKVYHGSYMEIDEIDLSKCEPYRDFGKTEYNFIENAFNLWKFHVLRFADYSEEWLDFVVMNRNPDSIIPAHDYDIVEGPVADDKVTIRLDIYLAGGLSKKAFLEELKFFKYTHQICLCTQRSLQALERMPRKEFIENIDDIIVQSLVSDYNFSEKQSLDVYFGSKTYNALIDESTGLYQKTWTEVYQLLLRELNLNNKQLKK